MAQVMVFQGLSYRGRMGKVIHTYMSKRKLTKKKWQMPLWIQLLSMVSKDYEIKLVYDDQFADLQKLKKEKEAQPR